MYQDRALTCRDCTEEFIFSAGEQTFYATKGLTNDPQRCPTCRAAAKRARSTDGPREFHAAICGACGGQAVVPFAPRNDRPVYCSSCFDKVRAGTITTEAPAPKRQTNYRPNLPITLVSNVDTLPAASPDEDPPIAAQAAIPLAKAAQ